MRVCLVRADRGGSGFYRVDEPARVARLAGVEIEVVEDLKVKAYKHPTGYIEVAELLHDADVIVLQRPLSQPVNAVAIAAKRQGIALVADLDDDFHNVHLDNIAYSAVDPVRSPLHNKHWLMATVKLCDVVTVSTPLLLKYAVGRTMGVLVRNRLPQRILDLPATPLTGRAGWTGTMSTHPADLARARGVLGLVDTPLAVVGDDTGVANALGVHPRRVQLTSAWSDSVEDYWRNVKSAMDVGIAPLETSKFNKSKSWLKPWEYLALGKPFVASPLPEYRYLVDVSHAGEIATSSTQWAGKVRDMLEDGQSYRDAGLKWANENVIELHIDNWIQAWELACATRSS